MNFEWVVTVWTKISDKRTGENPYGEYRDVVIYQGDNRRSAMRAARKAKDGGAKCVTIRWR